MIDVMGRRQAERAVSLGTMFSSADVRYAHTHTHTHTEREREREKCARVHTRGHTYT